MLFQVLPVIGQEDQKQKDWTGKLRNGTIITYKDLNTILSEHEKWSRTDGKEGKRAELSGASLRYANLSGVELSGADLSRADLRDTDLRETFLSEANLSGANLEVALLTFAVLDNANMREANLYGADLQYARLFETDLSGAFMKDVDLRKADFEIKPNSLPYIPAIAFASGLSEMYYSSSTHALVELRKAFKDAGLRKQEQEITYAIKFWQRNKLWLFGNWSNKLEAVFNYFFFELTCKYGMTPGRPLIILVCLIPLFSFFYVFGLKTKRQKTGLWLVFLKGRILKATKEKEERPFRLTSKFPPRVTPEARRNKIKLRIIRSYRIIRIALYFSLLSATSIGWREFNIGNWITRIQRREYIVRATGWVRTVSGLQSLISVYLLALWVLTYFGRPFEAV
jgi:hypothetical protein